MATQITTVVRGNIILFTAQFFDVNDCFANPDSANLYVYYTKLSVAHTDTVAMTVTSTPSIWTATWNSNGIDPALVSWSVASMLNSTTIVEDGSFVVSANPANQSRTH
jgi:hypothetical protein